MRSSSKKSSSVSSYASSISSSGTKQSSIYNSQMKRKSTGLIESVTRVNVSDGILASGNCNTTTTSPTPLKRETITSRPSSTSTTNSNLAIIAGMTSDYSAVRQMRSGSTIVEPVTSLDNLVASFPIAVLGSSSSTDYDNEPIISASIDYNSDDEGASKPGVVNFRQKFASTNSSPMRYLAARNAALASSNSSLNGSLSSATSTATKLTVKKTFRFIFRIKNISFC